MAPFRRTATWVLATALVVYLVLSGLGALFLASHENAIATSIFDEHLGTVVSIYLRILLGYLAAGFLVALVLHPFVPGWKAAPAALVLILLGFVHTLTRETHLLYGPTQSLFCAVHDAIPAAVRNLYRPWLIEAGLAVLVVLSLHRWTRRVPARIKATVSAAALLVVGLTLLPGDASAARQGRPCFLLIATDSLRADHLSCNGYVSPTRPDLPTSPHIDALAERGCNFARCLVPTASTHESWISMLSSTEPRTHGLRHMFPSRRQVEAVERGQVFLPRLARRAGYATAALGGWCGTTFSLFDLGFEHVDVSDAQNHRALVAEAAFTNHLLAAAFLDNPAGRLLLPELERVSFTRGASALTRRTKAWLDAAAEDERPFFLVVVYHVTHLPYSASHPYYTLYTDPEYRGRNRYRIDFRIDEMIKRGFDHDLTEEEKRHIVNLYDGCVREFDDQVGELVEHLKRIGLFERTIVGVVADHGDDLYEHGTTLGHGVTLFGGDQANHIPAVFAGPGVAPRRVDPLVRSFDLTPTWLGWLGLEAPARWEGVDLRGEIPDLTALLETSYLLYRQPVPDLEAGELVLDFPTLDRATFLDPDFDHNLVLREELNDEVIATKCYAVRESHWKLIVVPGEGGPIVRLFHLGLDPRCRINRAHERPEVVARLKRSLPGVIP
jgi:arylsulfatase A-like enzyme